MFTWCAGPDTSEGGNNFSYAQLYIAFGGTRLYKLTLLAMAAMSDPLETWNMLVRLYLDMTKVKHCIG